MTPEEANQELLRKRAETKVEVVHTPADFDAARLLRLQTTGPSSDAIRRQKDAQEAAKADLRASWNVPARHAAHFYRLDRSGAWEESRKKLATRLGTGFTAALVGGRGNGKTQLAVELMRETTESLKPALFLTCAELLMRIKATYRKDSTQTEADVIKELRRPKLLVIDEFDKRAETDWEFNLLFELANKRYGDMTDTLFIANLTEARFREVAGASLVSRMNESGGLVVCDWGSFR